MMASGQFASEVPDGIAVDFGGTKIAVARLRSGEIVDKRWLETDASAEGEQQIRTVFEAIGSLSPLDGEPIAVAATGRIDQDGCWYAINEQTLSDIDGLPLQQRLTDLLSRPVTVVNDAVAGAIGEAYAGAGQNCARFAYVTVSTGVGGTCVLDGVPVTSPNGLAGNIGFMTSRRGIERCGSGRLGTVECIASGKAIARAAARLGHSGLSAKEVFDYSNKGAAWAVSLIHDSALAIAELGANLAAVAGVTRMIVGGSVGLAHGYCNLVTDAMQEEPELFRLEIVPAKLAEDSVLVGALVYKKRPFRHLF